MSTEDPGAELRPWPPRERGPALDLVVAAHRRIQEGGSAPARETLAARVAADVVMTPPPVLGSFRPYFGADGVLEWLRQAERRWPDLRLEPEAYAAAGHHVVVLGRLIFDGREESAALLWTVRDGRVRGVRGFRYASEALARLAALATADASSA
jgi:ketosteroid isomerase-like protein